MQKRISHAISACFMAAGLAAGTAMAQQATTPVAPTTAPTASYSDADLEKFISASKQVAMISQEYTPKIQAAEDDASKRQVYEEADRKMVAAVQQQGITVEQFNGINQALQHDPALLKRVQAAAQ